MFQFFERFEMLITYKDMYKKEQKKDIRVHL